MTLPVIAYHFRLISLSALIANPLVLPVQPALMVLGLAAVALGIVWLPFGRILGWLASLLAGYTNWMVSLLAKIPGTISLPQISLWVVIACFTLLFVWLWLYPRSRNWLVRATLIAGLALASIGAWTAGLRISDGMLHIRILAASDHPALMLQTPKGNRLLLNGLPDQTELQNAIQNFLPAFDRHLDALLITNPDPTTITSVHDAVGSFPVSTILWGLQGEGNSETRWLESDLRQLDTTSQLIETGNTYDLDGITIIAMNISDTARSLIIRYANFELIIPDGALGKELAKTVPPTSTLLLNQTESSDPDLLAWKGSHPLLTVSPVIAPADWVNWLTLAKGGWIEIITDGAHLWIRQSR
jgi:competence protein ComEC